MIFDIRCHRFCRDYLHSNDFQGRYCMYPNLANSTFNTQMKYWEVYECRAAWKICTTDYWSQRKASHTKESPPHSTSGMQQSLQWQYSSCNDAANTMSREICMMGSQQTHVCCSSPFCVQWGTNTSYAKHAWTVTQQELLQLFWKNHRPKASEKGAESTFFPIVSNIVIVHDRTFPPTFDVRRARNSCGFHVPCFLCRDACQVNIDPAFGTTAKLRGNRTNMTFQNLTERRWRQIIWHVSKHGTSRVQSVQMASAKQCQVIKPSWSPLVPNRALGRNILGLLFVYPLSSFSTRNSATCNFYCTRQIAEESLRASSTRVAAATDFHEAEFHHQKLGKKNQKDSIILSHPVIQ